MSQSTLSRVRPRTLFVISICTVLVVVALVWNRAQRAATTIVVNSTSDVVNPSDGLCTLREAITAANTNTASGAVAGECAAGSSSVADTIDLTGVTGTINLPAVLPDLNSDMTINGPGANQLTIMRSTAAGTPNFRVFFIQSAVNVSLVGLTISGGSPIGNGGGLINLGSLSLTNVTISGNSVTTASRGGGIFSNGGALTLTNSTVSGNKVINGGGGGGIEIIAGTATVTNSTISGNTSAGSGAGIENFGVLVLANSTVSGNTADTSPSGNGGGIYAGGSSGSLTILDSTIRQPCR
ncbi:MAG TPA: CSLREA domain-containing protein [Pyrinomonadaceae bacterium]|nr:CSLREA domain-containing protein [Pyrinomonadaceae bacterium]